MCISPPVTPTWKPGSGAELTTNGASLLPLLLLHQKFFLQSPKPKGCAAALGAGGSGSPDKPPASPKAKFVNNTLTRSRGNRGRKFNHTGVVQNPSHCFSSGCCTENDPSCVSSILSFPDFSPKSSKKHSSEEEVSWRSLLLYWHLSCPCSSSINQPRTPPGL